MYKFINEFFPRHIIDGTYDKAEILARRWEALKLAIAHCSIAAIPAFRSSVAYFHRGELCTVDWTISAEHDYRLPIDAGSKKTILILGDCLANIGVADGSLVHIYGDLAARVTASGLCEIVIGGDIRRGAGIDGDGIIDTFVGGDLLGYVHNRGCSKTWINGSLRGEIGAGSPATQLYIVGDFDGKVEPIGDASLVYISVDGFMSLKDLEAVTSHRFTEFEATIGVSDQPPGIYPTQDWHRRDESGSNSWMRWVVHSQKS